MIAGATAFAEATNNRSNQPCSSTTRPRAALSEHCQAWTHGAMQSASASSVGRRAISITVSASMMLAGCSMTPGKEIYTADGSKARLISCGPEWENFRRQLASTPAYSNGQPLTGNATANLPPARPDWGYCLAQASKVCDACGYTVLESVPESGRMVIQCKG
jgi:hypothetical protein